MNWLKLAAAFGGLLLGGGCVGQAPADLPNQTGVASVYLTVGSGGEIAGSVSIEAVRVDAQDLPAPADGKYPCASVAPSTCLPLNTDGQPIGASDGGPVGEAQAAALQDLCPSDNVPEALWRFDYTLYQDDACTPGEELTGEGATEALVCYDVRDLYAREFPNRSYEYLLPGPNRNQIICHVPGEEPPQHVNVGAATGYYDAVKYSSTDPAYYYVDPTPPAVAYTETPSVVSVMAATAQQGSTSHAFAFEYTTGSTQIITFTDLSGVANTITVAIYDPDGTLNRTRSVSLAAYQTKTIIPLDDWGLPVTDDGTPALDHAYGIVASGTGTHMVLAHSDEQEHAGSGYSAIAPQYTVQDAWWGMYGYPDSGEKRDYFYLTNPSVAGASATVVVYDAAGTLLDTQVFALDPFQTVKLYPRADFTGVTSQNLGLHLTSVEGVAVSVYTQLGQDYDAVASPPWKTHDVVSGLFVPWSTQCLSSEYLWTDALSSGQQQSAARITNPNDTALTVTETWRMYDGSVYTSNTLVPAYGTAELPRPAGVENESGADPRSHNRILSAALPFHAHVSYFEQLDLPAVPATGFWWGEQTSSQTDTVFLVNPSTTDSVVIETEAYVGGSATPIAGNTITLGPSDSLMVQLPSEGSPGPADFGTGVFAASYTDPTYHFYSAAPFILHLQMPTYGDVLAQRCAGEVPTPDLDLQKYVSVDGGTTWFDADDPPGPTLDPCVAPQFKFVVTNTGNVELTDLEVTDDVLGVIGTLQSLLPGASSQWIVVGTAPEDCG